MTSCSIVCSQEWFSSLPPLGIPVFARPDPLSEQPFAFFFHTHTALSAWTLAAGKLAFVLFCFLVGWFFFCLFVLHFWCFFGGCFVLLSWVLFVLFRNVLSGLERWLSG